MSDILVEWTARPANIRVFTQGFLSREARLRAELASALDGKHAQQDVEVVGCSVQEEPDSELKARSAAIAAEQIRRKRAATSKIDNLLEQYFLGLSTYQCAIASSGAGSSSHPTGRLMLFCEIGGAIAALRQDLRTALVDRWGAYLAYQDQRRRVTKERKLELRSMYRNLSRRVKYKEALNRVNELLVARGIIKW